MSSDAGWNLEPKGDFNNHNKGLLKSSIIFQKSGRHAPGPPCETLSRTINFAPFHCQSPLCSSSFPKDVSMLSIINKIKRISNLNHYSRIFENRMELSILAISYKKIALTHFPLLFVSPLYADIK